MHFDDSRENAKLGEEQEHLEDTTHGGCNSAAPFIHSRTVQESGPQIPRCSRLESLGVVDVVQPKLQGYNLSRKSWRGRVGETLSKYCSCSPTCNWQKYSFAGDNGPNVTL